MIRPHTLPPEMIDDLALGLGGPAAIDALWGGQQSRRLLLLRLVADRLGRAPEAESALNAIIEAERQDPRSRTVLTEPLVGAWAAATVRATAEAPPTLMQVGHLGAIAAVAALRAGGAAELSAHAHGEWLYLPSLGRVRVDGPEGRVALTVESGRLSVNGTRVEWDDPRWQERRTLKADDLTVAFDDLDPYRDAYHVPAAERLTADAMGEWGHWLDVAWQILTTYAPERAAEIKTGLHSLVPLARSNEKAAHSATAREAVGVIGLDLPLSVADFAVALVHEFQHSKLSALLDIVPLYDDSSPRTFFAPWRRDPRPIGGLFQGVYAFLGVADAWHALSRDPVSFPKAEQEFADARLQVADAVETLHDSGLLTTDGRRFVGGMRASLEQLANTAVSVESVRHAQKNLAQLRAQWDGLGVR